jgi:protein ImuA
MRQSTKQWQNFPSRSQITQQAQGLLLQTEPALCGRVDPQCDSTLTLESTRTYEEHTGDADANLTIGGNRCLLWHDTENDELRPLERGNTPTNPIDEARAWHDGDARATIATLLADCGHLRRQVELAKRALSRGFTRGWRPNADRDALPDQQGARMQLNTAVIAELQEQIDEIAGGHARKRARLAFGIPEIDDRLNGGLAFGSTYEIAGGGSDAVTGAAAPLFAAGIAARTTGPVFWCVVRGDLFAPATAQAGLSMDRVTFVHSENEDGVLDSAEEILRFGGVAVMVAELVRLPMVASRRLQLAAEKSGTMGLIIRRWRRQAEATDFGQPKASATRWPHIHNAIRTFVSGRRWPRKVVSRTYARSSRRMLRHRGRRL